MWHLANTSHLSKDAYLRKTPKNGKSREKINLNYPLPVSNDPNEPIRQKWISDAYQLLKSGATSQGCGHTRGVGPA